MGAALVEACNLRKVFHDSASGEVVAVNDINFSCLAGEIYGLLGPNGAGKTTTLRTLATILKPTSGWARVCGFDVVERPDEVRKRIGFVSTGTGVYDRMSPWEMTQYFGRLQGMSEAEIAGRAEMIFELLGMNDFRNILGAKLSDGMKQKVSLARAMVHDPAVLILDEPTAGLDVVTARAVTDLIRQLRSEARCILLSTHIMSVAQKLCDRIAIIHQGSIIAEGTLDELRARSGEEDLEEVFFALVGAQP
jgi:sodium transport system ATP-binding protein